MLWRKLAVALVVWIVCSVSSHHGVAVAQTQVFWTGNGNDMELSNAANWDNADVPLTEAALIIPQDYPAATFQLTRQLRMNGGTLKLSAHHLEIRNGGELAIQLNDLTECDTLTLHEGGILDFFLASWFLDANRFECEFCFRSGILIS